MLNNGSLPLISESYQNLADINQYAQFSHLSYGVKFKYDYCSSKIFVKISSNTIALWDSNMIDKTWLEQGVYSFDDNDDIEKYVWIVEQC